MKQIKQVPFGRWEYDFETFFLSDKCKLSVISVKLKKIKNYKS